MLVGFAAFPLALIGGMDLGSDILQITFSEGGFTPSSIHYPSFYPLPFVPEE